MSRALFVVLLSLLYVLGTPGPASANGCNFAPFTLKDGTPMPGMQAGELVFGSARICGSLPRSLSPALTQRAFLDLQVHGTPVADIVPLGGGVMAPSTRMGCRGTHDYIYVLFEDGDLLLTDSGAAWPIGLAIDALLDVQPRARNSPGLPTACDGAYRKALAHALYPKRTAYTEAEIFEIAATTADDCQGDDFRGLLRGVALRSMLTWSLSKLTWGRAGQCLIRGSSNRPDEVVLTMECPDMPGQVIARLAPHAVPAFIGANSGMTADAIIHPMNETCLGAWELWETRPLEPVTPYRAE